MRVLHLAQEFAVDGASGSRVHDGRRAVGHHPENREVVASLVHLATPFVLVVDDVLPYVAVNVFVTAKKKTGKAYLIYLSSFSSLFASLVPSDSEERDNNHGDLKTLLKQ